jgi:hypothetical protein
MQPLQSMEYTQVPAAVDLVRAPDELFDRAPDELSLAASALKI